MTSAEKTEQLLRKMREQAIKKNQPPVAYMMSEADKKLYFNAGRWAGGARDYIARQAFLKLNELER